MKPQATRIPIFEIKTTNENLVNEYCRDIMELFKHEIYDGIHIKFDRLNGYVSLGSLKAQNEAKKARPNGANDPFFHFDQTTIAFNARKWIRMT